jgi:hypothetical protein
MHEEEIMTTKSYFIIGCKLLSIYCFILGAPLLFNAISTFFMAMDIPPDLKTSYFVGNLVMRITPIFLIGSGLYLLNKSEKVFEFAYIDRVTQASKIEESLLLAIKACGIFLIIQYSPDLLQSISSFVSYKTAPPVFDMLQQSSFLYKNAFSSIFGVSLGFYLLKDGSFFLRQGIKKN